AGKVPGVTSILNMLPKGFLSFWAAKSVAERTADNIGPVVALLASTGNRQAAVDLMKGAPRRDTAQAAEAGTAAHDLFERLAKGEEAGRVTPELAPYVGIFRGFEQQYAPEFVHLEQTVWSETHGYAGSFDFMARLTDPDTKETGLYIGDWKTTRSGVHAEVALQMTAYSRADYIVTPAGEKLEIPKLDGGVVVHARPEGGKVVPTRLDDELFEIFLALRRVWEYDREISKTVLGREVPIESVEEPKRRAARR